jgi:hypothetical protein
VKTITVSIDPDGVTRFLIDADSRPLLADNAIIRRASHVEPCSIALRVAFYALRAVVGDTGSVAAYTRTWRVLWRVNLSPIGGCILPGVFTNRADAINYEIDYLNEHFI